MENLTKLQAILMMISGLKITRKTWNKNDYIYFDSSDSKFKDDGGNDAGENLRFEQGYVLIK